MPHNPPGTGDGEVQSAAAAAASASVAAVSAASGFTTAAATILASMTAEVCTSDAAAIADSAAIIAEAAAAIADAAAAIKKPQSVTSPSKVLTSRFMDLPMELRLQIYEYLVVVGKVFYIVNSDHTNTSIRLRDHAAYRKPSLAILRVSRQVREEAEDVYFTKNLFILPPNFYASSPFFPSRTTDQRPLFSDEAHDRIKHVSVEISNVGLNNLGLDTTRWAKIRPGFDASSEQERRDIAHRNSVSESRHHTIQTDLTISHMKAVQSVEVDYQNAFCLAGCCRMTSIYLQWAQLLDRMQSVRFVGLRDDREREALMTSWMEGTEANKMYTSGLEAKDHPMVSFGEDEDVWAVWKVDAEAT